MLHAHRLDKLQHRDSGRARPVHDNFQVFQLAARKMAGIDDAGGRNDRRAVLVIMKDGDIERLAQALLR